MKNINTFTDSYTSKNTLHELDDKFNKTQSTNKNTTDETALIIQRTSEIQSAK